MPKVIKFNIKKCRTWEYCNWNQETNKNMKLLYISLVTLKANYKIGVFVEKTEILSVQGRVLDCERQIKRDLWKLKRPEGERQWEYERREKAKRREKTESLTYEIQVVTYENIIIRKMTRWGRVRLKSSASMHWIQHDANKYMICFRCVFTSY